MATYAVSFSVASIVFGVNGVPRTVLGGNCLRDAMEDELEMCSSCSVGVIEIR